MIEVHLAERQVFPWRSVGRLHVRGEWRHPSSGLIPRAEDLLTMVVKDEESVTAAVDRCRSFPIFYGVRGGDLFLSDDARWVRSRLGEEVRSEVAWWEASVAGFVSGRDTLFPSVKQVQAGELLRASCSADGISIELRPWDRPETESCGTLQETSPRPERDRFDELDEVLHGVSNRLVEALDGRLLVIPLTGGYDSRLVAILAKTAGYDRVLCLGSQRRHHWEARVSSEVAERLGFEWVHFGYEPRQWSAWFESEERRRYYRDADGLCAMPSIVEWPALLELRRSGRAPEDAVIAPGHYGNFVTGSATPEDPHAGDQGSAIEAALQDILQRRYCLNAWPRSTVERALLSRVREAVRHAAEGAEDLDEVIDRWEWREYQAKQTGLCVRAYESCGFEWRLPLASREFVQYWRRVSRAERFENRLHHRWVEEKGRAWNLPPPNPGVVPLSRRRLRRWARRVGMLAQARRLRRLARRFDKRRILREDGLGWSCLIDPRELLRTYTGLEGVQSYLVRDWLENLDHAGSSDLSSRDAVRGLIQLRG